MSDDGQNADSPPPEEQGLTGHIGPMEVDWPRSIGYFGGIALATAFELIDPPLALFVAAIPFLKMLNRPGASRPVRFVSQFFDGMAKPVGGDAAGTVRLTGLTPLPEPRPTPGRPTPARSSARRRALPAPH